MRIADQSWDFDGATSGGLSAIGPVEPGTHSVLYITFSSIATTTFVELQSALASSGPWFAEGNSSLAAVGPGTNASIRVEGPIGPFVRPHFRTPSTGVWRLSFLTV